MSQVEWYYARDNKQKGPVSSVDLKRLAASGELKAEDLVWREGMTEWAPAKNVRGLFENEGRAGGASPTVAGLATVSAASADNSTSAAPALSPVEKKPRQHLFDTLIEMYRPMFNAQLLERINKTLLACGSYGLWTAAVVAVAFTTIVAMSSASQGFRTALILSGLTTILILVSLQYVAAKSYAVLDQVNRDYSGTLSTLFVPNCLVVLAKLVGVVFFIGMISMAVTFATWEPVFFGAVAFLLALYVSAIAMNVEPLGIKIAAEPLPGGEWIGVVIFLAKVIMRTSVAVFGIGAICGTLLLGYACYMALSGVQILPGNDVAISGQPTAALARSCLIFAGLAPLTAYLLFLLVNLVLNIWRAILSLPGKLEQVERRSETPDTPETQIISK